MDPKTMDTVFMSLKEFLITSLTNCDLVDRILLVSNTHTHEQTEV